MTLAGWFALAVVVGVLVLLGTTRHPPYAILVGGLAMLLVAGVVDPAAALAGFGNPGLVTVAVLFVVAAGLRQTGALTLIVNRALGRPTSTTQAQTRLIAPVVAGSAFLNNTPLVAMLTPVVIDWSRSIGVPASMLLLPLSYAAVLGGLCTLVGTSTNLVVNGLLVESGYPGLGLFEIAWVGVPCAVAGSVLLSLMAPRLLPSRHADPVVPGSPREYTVEMVVTPTGPLVGRSIAGAGLRHLPGLFLVEIHRGRHLLPVVEPGERLEAGDQLVFAGVVDSVVDLQRIAGLEAATEQVFKLDVHRTERCFVEAVVGPTCPLVGQTIREGRFRTRYGAVVLAVSRGGARIAGRLGDIQLHLGDALLLEAQSSFVDRERNSRDFYLVSRLDGAGPSINERAPVALAILGAMVVLVAAGVLAMVQAALAAAVAMVLTRCCSEESARRSIDWTLVLAVGASFGLARGLEETGAAEAVAATLLAPAGDSPRLGLVVVYGTTMLLSELVTNNAAAVLMFPIAMSTAAQLEVSHWPFAVAVMMAASASFATPLGYQTHLMVYGLGGYRLRDFLRMGVPMDLAIWTLTSVLAPLVWPF